MSKDREGKFHPAKGKPSGANKEEGLGLRKNYNPDDLERDLEMTDRYTTDSDRLSDDVRIRHRNRNTSKGEVTKTDDESNKGRQETNSEDVPTTATAEELVPIIPKELFSYLSSYQSSI